MNSGLRPLPGQGGKFVDIVEAQQTSIGDQYDALDGEALQSIDQHRLECLGFGDIAGMDGMHDWQALGSLHHTEHELPGDAAGLFVHSESAQIVVNFPFAMNPHGGQVIEDDSQLPIDQRTYLSCQLDLDDLGTVHQRIHCPQQVLMGDDLRNRRHGDGLQPTEATEFGVRGAEPVEDHRPDQGFGLDPTPPGSQGTTKRAIEPKIFPQAVQGKHIAVAARGFISDLGLRRIGSPGGTTEAPD